MLTNIFIFVFGPEVDPKYIRIRIRFKKNIPNIFVFVFGPPKNIRFALHNFSRNLFWLCPLDIKWQYIGKEAAKKSKGTFFSSNFKVTEKSVFIFFILYFLSRDLTILWYCSLDMLFTKMAISWKRDSKTKY